MKNSKSSLTDKESKAIEEKTRSEQRKRRYQEMGVHLRLKELREHLGLTQAEMADLFETSQSYYSTYEDGTRMVTAPILLKLAEQGISADYLIAGKGQLKFAVHQYNAMDTKLLQEENKHLRSENDFLKKQVQDLMEVLKKK